MARVEPHLLAPVVPVVAGDPAPVTMQQLRALTAGAGRELAWGLRATKAEAALWRKRADAIPDAEARELVLAALDEGRVLIDGAAIFWILPPRRRPDLLRLLVALQTLLNVLDLVFEREARGSDRRPGSWMWLAHEALDITRPSPERAIKACFGNDGGYLSALVMECRRCCATLPLYPQARDILVGEAARSLAFEIEHDRDVPRRNAAMQAHVAQHFSGVTGMAWWEIIGGASALFGAMVVLALAADEAMTPDDFRQAADAYVCVAAAGALLDSYADRPVDLLSGSHNWFDHYQSEEEASRRVAELVQDSMRQVSALRNAERHVVIVASMAALWLSSDTVRSPERRSTTAAIAQGAGATTRLLIPILRAWRMAYGRTSD